MDVSKLPKLSQSPAPPPAQSSAVAADPPSKSEKRSGGVKDTIESILIAFILAFIFRAFVVEAFVIPTGSMATTLMGAHMKFTCLDCDYHWRVNYNAQQVGDDLIIPSRAQVETEDALRRKRMEDRVYYLVCPNCGYRMPRQNQADPDNDATAPPIDFGDRILVLKYLYLFSDPQRWDVVVFKSPADPKYQTNYIKRLVGKPGESVMVLDGDVYVGAKGQPVEQFKVQTKPHHAQEALWRIVYDNDFQPKNGGKQRFVYDKDGVPQQDEDPRWRQPWVQQSGGNGWTTGGAAPGQHAFKFDNTGGAGTLLFDPTPQSLNWPLTSWLGYNISMEQHAIDSYNHRPIDPPIQVSDLKLQLYYQRHAGDGSLKLSMSKRADVFTLEITRNMLRLMRGDEVLSEKAYTAPSRPVKIEFTNVDYRVSVRIDDREVLATTPEQYSPKMAELLAAYAAQERPQRRPQISIEAAGQQATLQHVSLWRDVYYTNREPRIRWGTPAQPMVLGDDEYFVLGDNSSNSLDARFWNSPIRLPAEDLNVEDGRVPARFMLGKAFFVYWPAGHKIVGTGLVPNVGEMRFIH